MKNIHKKIFALLIIAGLNGCDSDLELAPISSISTNSFWKTENDAEGALYGMYAQFRNTFNMNLLYWGDYRSGFWTVGTSGGANDHARLWSNNLDASTTGTNWSSLYTLINDCNLVLKYVPNITFRNEARKSEILGHAFFLRAFAYFKLAQLWGDVPIALEGFESVDQELSLSRSPVGEVYEIVKNDVAQAVELLPAGTPGDTPYMGSKAAASMLKAEAYLWIARTAGGGSAELQAAKEAVDYVLSTPYSLEADYEDVFRDESSNEIIFSIYFDQLEGTQYGNQFINQVNNVPAGARDTIPYQAGPQWLTLNTEFTQGHLRPAAEDSRTRVIWREVSRPTGNPIKWINKYLGEVIEGTRSFTSDIRIYRFADAILLKAEVENALGNKDVAVSELNKVAYRAYGIMDYYPTSLTEAEVDDAILEERLIEFAAEGKAWFDIRRFGKAFEVITSLVGREGEKEGNILLFPVDQDVINRNTNIIQTSGY